MATKPGGYGREAYGDPFGAGGPVNVVRALAVAGQTVRVVFSGEPLHRSPAGAADGLNPGNYFLSVVSGAATAPVAVGVDVALVVGPARGVGNGVGNEEERALDVHVDRQLVVGITYQISVRNLRAQLGGLVGAPYAASFPGVTLLQETQLPQRSQDLVDIANPPALGTFQVDDSGDLMVEDPDAGLRKRVFRRLTTRRGAFSFLPNYGLAIPLKGVGSVARMASLRVDAQGQLALEPDIAQVAVRTSLTGTGIVLVDTTIKSRRGTAVPIGLTVSPDGTATPV